MSKSLIHVRLDDLILNHQEVKRKAVRKYMTKIYKGELIEPVSLSYCIHHGRYFLNDGHHRTAAIYTLGGTWITGETEPCYIYKCNGEMHDDVPYHPRNFILK